MSLTAARRLKFDMSDVCCEDCVKSKVAASCDYGDGDGDCSMSR